jgi:hypothetical protein
MKEAQSYGPSIPTGERANSSEYGEAGMFKAMPDLSTWTEK